MAKAIVMVYTSCTNVRKISLESKKLTAVTLSIFEHLIVIISVLFLLFGSVFLCLKKLLWSALFFSFFMFFFVPVYKQMYQTQNGISSDKKNETTLRIIQQNCWGRNHDAEALMTMLKKRKPDIVFLQECSSEIFEQLKEFCITSDYQMASQYECEAGRVYKSRLIILARGFRFLRNTGSLQVPLQHVVLKGNEEGEWILHLVNTHLARPYDVDLSYYERFMQKFPNKNVRLILAGDFNLTPWSSAFKFIKNKSHLRDTRQGFGFVSTYPAKLPILSYKVPIPFPVIPIDAILVSSHFQVTSFKRMPSIGSDHYGIEAIVSLGAM